MNTLLRCLCIAPLLFLINAKVVTIHKNDGSAAEKYLAYDVHKITFASGSIGVDKPAISAHRLTSGFSINRNATRIMLTLAENAFVAADLYNASGCRVLSLERAHHPAGTRAIALPGRSLARGIYFVTVRYNGKMLTKRFAIVR